MGLPLVNNQLCVVIPEGIVVGSQILDIYMGTIISFVPCRISTGPV